MNAFHALFARLFRHDPPARLTKTERLAIEQLDDRCLPSASLTALTHDGHVETPHIIGQHIGTSVATSSTETTAPIIHRHPSVVDTDITKGTHGGGGGGGSGKASIQIALPDEIRVQRVEMA
jgi:hypothetical protein